jgi:hypothetical protein
MSKINILPLLAIAVETIQCGWILLNFIMIMLLFSPFLASNERLVLKTNRKIKFAIISSLIEVCRSL